MIQSGKKKKKTRTKGFFDVAFLAETANFTAVLTLPASCISEIWFKQQRYREELEWWKDNLNPRRMKIFFNQIRYPWFVYCNTPDMETCTISIQEEPWHGHQPQKHLQSQRAMLVHAQSNLVNPSRFLILCARQSDNFWKLAGTSSKLIWLEIESDVVKEQMMWLCLQ